MNYRNSMLSVAVAATFACASLPAFSADLRVAQTPIQGQYIVVLKDNAASLSSERNSLSRVSVVARNIAAQHRAKLLRSYNNVLRGFVVKADDRALARLLADPRVAYVEEDGMISISATQTNATWGIDRVDQRALPLDTSYTYSTTAPTVHAYVLDTGVLLNHSQFSGRIGNGYDAVTQGGNANDCHGHGTHVTGTLGGTIHGIAKEVKIHPVRVLGCNGSGANSGVVAGMDWVVSNQIKPAVANMSLGDVTTPIIDEAVQRMHDAGVTVVVAAGNQNGDACKHSPARAPAAITVGSTEKNDARSSFSNYGTCLDIFAPGSNITSAGYSSPTGTANMSGTSMASPHVAGVAALYLASNPSATPTQVRNAIVNNATTGKVTDAKPGSPNLLLYSVFGGTPPPGNYSVSGTVTSSTGAGIGGVTVSNGTVSATTNSSGAYTLSGLANATYTLTPSLSGYTFTPASRSVTVNSANVTGINFSGVTGGGGNVQTYTNANDVAIKDHSTVVSPITVSGRTGSGSATTPVVLDIKHTFRGDLKVDLVAPDGSVYVLKNYNSRDSADNVIGTINVNLSSEALNGTWQLRVSDNVVNDIGYIDSWSITF